MLTRVLVPLDGTPAGEAVVPLIGRWLRGTGAVVYLLAVRPTPRTVLCADGWILYLDELMAHERAQLEEYLARVGSQLAYDGIAVRRVVRFGEAVEEIAAAAAEHAVDCIALAAAPRVGLWRLLGPSLAERLRARSGVPVVALAASAPAAQPAVPWFGRLLKLSG
ncbi:MAG TPA: universal stress protein [Chloroflexota bacterium]|nr:universal stress protein [Chloroflexota bacterium]